MSCALLAQLGIVRVHLVLHDLGGFWDLHWAARHSQQVASLTLFNVGLKPGFRWHKFARIWRTPIVGELFQLCATRRTFSALLQADNPRPFPPGFTDRIYDEYNWGTRRAVLKLSMIDEPETTRALVLPFLRKQLAARNAALASSRPEGSQPVGSTSERELVRSFSR